MNNTSLRARGLASRQFAIPKGRNVGVSRKIGGAEERGRAAMDFARISLLKGGSGRRETAYRSGWSFPRRCTAFDKYLETG